MQSGGLKRKSLESTSKTRLNRYRLKSILDVILSSSLHAISWAVSSFTLASPKYCLASLPLSLGWFNAKKCVIKIGAKNKTPPKLNNRFRK